MDRNRKAQTRRFRQAAHQCFYWLVAMMNAILEDGLLYRSASLAYTSLLSFVPGMAICFSLLKTFGIHNQLQPFLLDFLKPIGSEAPVLVDKLLLFIENINVGVLGFFGLISLLYMIISMLGGIEAALNDIWRVKAPRGLVKRAGDYLSIALLGPVLGFSSTGLSGFITSSRLYREIKDHSQMEEALMMVDPILTFIPVALVFALIYGYIPRTQVHWKAALWGGCLGALGWKLSGFWFSHFIVVSATYQAMYSSLLIFVLILMWVQCSWLILLLGAADAMFYQHPHRISTHYEFRNLGADSRINIGLTLITLIAKAFIQREPEWSVERLAKWMKVPHDVVNETLGLLLDAGLIEATAREDLTYIPAVDLSSIKIQDIIEALKNGTRDPFLTSGHTSFGLEEVSDFLRQQAEAQPHPGMRCSLREFSTQYKP